MCLHIDSLPDDCLLPIFDLVPLLDLLHLDQVCSRWKVLLPSACARRRTLVLIGGSERKLAKMNCAIPLNSTFEVSCTDDRESYFHLPVVERFASLTLSKFITVFTIGDGTETDFTTELARLHHARFSGQLVTYLTDLFPNVDTLVVVHPDCDENEFNLVIGLLGFWSLSTLKLWIQTSGIDKQYFDRLDQHPVRTLLHSINQQSSLQQLTLQCKSLHIPGNWHQCNYDITFPSELYSFIGRLKEVKLCNGWYDERNTIWDTVHQFDHPELRHISLGNLYNLRVEVALNPALESITTKVHQLYSCLYFKTVEQLGEFCWRFASLTLLRMAWWPDDIAFTQLVTNLASLTQLTHLDLSFSLRQQPKNVFSLMDRVDDNKEVAQQVSLPQVKILTLYIVFCAHDHFESLSPRVFPSVQMIILVDDPDDCTICRPMYTNRKHDHEWANRCHRRLILSVKNKFARSNSTVRLYARYRSSSFGDWTNYVPSEDDELPEICHGDIDDGDGADDDQSEEQSEHED